MRLSSSNYYLHCAITQLSNRFSFERVVWSVHFKDLLLINNIIDKWYIFYFYWLFNISFQCYEDSVVLFAIFLFYFILLNSVHRTKSIVLFIKTQFGRCLIQFFVLFLTLFSQFENSITLSLCSKGTFPKCRAFFFFFLSFFFRCSKVLAKHSGPEVSFPFMCAKSNTENHFLFIDQ